MTETVDFTEGAAVYSLFLVFAETELIETRASGDEAIRLTKELDSVFTELTEEHVRVRGVYDLTGFDASASVMIWLTSETVDDLQWAKRQLHRTQILGDTLAIESILTLGVSELADEPGGWISFVPVSPGPVDEEFEGEEIDDPDIDNLDEEFEDDDDTTEATPADLEDLDLAADGEAGAQEAILETTSLHAQIGTGPVRLFAAVEADDPGELIGPSLGLLENGLMTVATPRTGRFVTPAELYEILR
ncbi:chlorite dismutase family protein [Gulosibacter chungangensis]|uniref:hydrogen peroxide-dependent heme synthase n=1 Tax=Gulosibacter chungangensis TaxID=979746 RepID=A0A7J5BFG5_9MICO|nr:chlorite dismutase family protein [Gulosibacter chungangensis]KAB1645011.1 chlorite dismutase family protein [Gulosibacter chungangensis]